VRVSPPSDAPLKVEFCGEWHEVAADTTFAIGRDGDLVVDDNPYLHRRFLEISNQGGFWWLANNGTQLSATLADRDGRFQAWLAPGASLPLVFPDLLLRFSAGSTSYEIAVVVPTAQFVLAPPVDTTAEATTLGVITLTPEQLDLIVALAEPILRSPGGGRTTVPSSAEAARRLGWPLTKFNRKLDNVCQKLKRAGVQGLHGRSGDLAADRRARLVEYALAVRLVTPADTGRLDHCD
jgi:hypothetical protein